MAPKTHAQKMCVTFPNSCALSKGEISRKIKIVAIINFDPGFSWRVEREVSPRGAAGDQHATAWVALPKTCFPRVVRNNKRNFLTTWNRYGVEVFGCRWKNWLILARTTALLFVIIPFVDPPMGAFGFNWDDSFDLATKLGGKQS